MITEDKEKELDYDHIIYKFNKMLQSGEFSRDECYAWLKSKKEEREAMFEKKHGFHLCMDFNYLYPEVFGPTPETFEKWKDDLVGKRLNGIPLKREELVEKYGEEEVAQMERWMSKTQNKKFSFND